MIVRVVLVQLLVWLTCAHSQRIDVRMVGEPKSGTTFFEVFVHNFLALACVSHFRSFQHSERASHCSWHDGSVSIKPDAKHDMFEIPFDNGGYPQHKLLADCYGKSVDIVQAVCVEPLANSFLSTVSENRRFVLVLRDPLSVITSRYYHFTTPAEVSQAGLDAFVVREATHIFTNIAVRYLAHSTTLSNISIVWDYMDPLDEVVRALSEWLMLVPGTECSLLEAVRLSSSKAQMRKLDAMLPIDDAKHGKVRNGGALKISDTQRIAILKASRHLLPPELWERWYAAEVDETSHRKANSGSTCQLPVQSMTHHAENVLGMALDAGEAVWPWRWEGRGLDLVLAGQGEWGCVVLMVRLPGRSGEAAAPEEMVVEVARSALLHGRQQVDAGQGTDKSFGGHFHVDLPAGNYSAVLWLASPHLHRQAPLLVSDDFSLRVR